MKSNSLSVGVVLAAAVLSTATLKADDKPAPAATNSAPAAPGAPKLEDLFPDKPVAKGTGFQIMRSTLDDAVANMRAGFTAQGRKLSPSDLPALEKLAFDQLLQVELLKEKATTEDKAKGKIQADKSFEILHKRMPSEEAFARQLKLMNLTVDQLKARMLDEAVAEQVLRDKVTVTDAQIKKFYDDNPSKFEDPEMVRASHILISTRGKNGEPLSDDEKMAKRKIIDGLLKRARAGEDFAQLAREYSDDPGSKDKGGEYIFSRGQMMKEFEAAAFSLQTNQVSDVVTTPYGYHIIKLSEKIPAKKHSFSEPDVVTYIRNGLEGREIEKILPDYYASLKKEAKVQILDQQLKDILDAAEAAAAEAAKIAPKDAGLIPPPK